MLEIERQKDREPTEEELLKREEFEAKLREIRERPMRELREKMTTPEIEEKERKRREKLQYCMECDAGQRDYLLKAGDGKPREPTKFDKVEGGLLKKAGLQS